MTRVSPLRIQDLLNVLLSWNLDAFPDESDEQRTQRFLDDTANTPEARRRQINALADLLADESIALEDKDDLVGEGVNRAFANQGDAVAWLADLVDGLTSQRPVERTTRTGGTRPSLIDTHEVRGVLGRFKPDVGSLPLPGDAARAFVRLRPGRADSFAHDLLMLMNSDHTDRDKADLIVATVGPFFYSDLEAIEWAAEMAMAIQNHPRVVE